MDDKERRKLNGKVYPKYVRTYEGYIGVFAYFDFGEFPVYRFNGGVSLVGRWELEHGSDDRETLLKKGGIL